MSSGQEALRRRSAHDLRLQASLITAGIRGFRPTFLFTVSVVAACATAVIWLLAMRLGAYGVVLIWIGVPFALGHAVTALFLRVAETLESGGNPNE